jgi:hypothetical protein
MSSIEHPISNYVTTRQSRYHERRLILQAFIVAALLRGKCQTEIRP